MRPAIIHRRRPTTATTATATMSAADALLVALAEAPASAAEIAPSAGVGRSTATKALAGLAASAKVERSAGGRDGGRRVADRRSLPPGEMTPGIAQTPPAVAAHRRGSAKGSWPDWC